MIEIHFDTSSNFCKKFRDFHTDFHLDRPRLFSYISIVEASNNNKNRNLNKLLNFPAGEKHEYL